MIKRKDITKYNIDDYVRQEKKIKYEIGLTRKRIFWNKEHWNMFSEFVEAVMGTGYKLKNGEMFLGVKHFKK